MEVVLGVFVTLLWVQPHSSWYHACTLYARRPMLHMVAISTVELCILHD